MTFPLLDPATATGTAADLLDRAQHTMGALPNMVKAMANSPTLLAGYLALAEKVDGGTLPAAIRERLAINTAALNGCAYCLSAHTYLGSTLAKIDPDELERARSATSSDPHTAALLTLSASLLRQTGHAMAAELDAAHAAGVTDDQIGELILNLALNVLTNYFNVIAGVENDWPPVS